MRAGDEFPRLDVHLQTDGGGPVPLWQSASEDEETAKRLRSACVARAPKNGSGRRRFDWEKSALDQMTIARAVGMSGLCSFTSKFSSKHSR
jgi:hypothetical protein